MPARLDNSPADITAALIAALGLGTAPDANGDWPVFVADEPDRPDNCVTVYDSPDSPVDGREMNSGRMLANLSIQVRVRATTHEEGYAKANEIHTAMLEDVYQEHVEVQAAHYLVHCFSKPSPVRALGTEQGTISKRRIFTFDALVTLKKTN